MILLDTCIIVDLLRGHEAAARFLATLAQAPALSVITATELIAGVRNTQERRHIDRLLENCAVYGIDLEIGKLAGDYARQYRPSHSVDPIDALIAATAKVADLDLVTLNIKHFPMFAGLNRPY